METSQKVGMCRASKGSVTNFAADITKREFEDIIEAPGVTVVGSRLVDAHGLISCGFATYARAAEAASAVDFLKERMSRVKADERWANVYGFVFSGPASQKTRSDEEGSLKDQPRKEVHAEPKAIPSDAAKRPAARPTSGPAQLVVFNIPPSKNLQYPDKYRSRSSC